jgi:hypothetical protein
VELADLGPHGHPQLGVQVGERLVKKKYLWLTHDGPSHCDTLPLPSRELFGFSVEKFMDPEDVGCLLHTPVDLFFGKLAHFQPESEVLPDIHVRVESVVLKDHRDIPILGRDVVHQTIADIDLAGCHRLQAGDHPERCGLTASGGPHQHCKFLVLDFNAQAINCRHRLELFRHIFQNHTCHFLYLYLLFLRIENPEFSS